MPKYYFRVTLSAEADNIDLAWIDAIADFIPDPGVPPDPDDPQEDYMTLVVCEECEAPLKYYKKDLDGTNLEEVYGCPHCETVTEKE